MKIRNITSYGPIPVVAILAAFTFAQPALSDCVQSDPPADTILDIDANSGCANIQDQEGCTIDKVDNGTCTYIDPVNKDINGDPLFFTVDSELNTDGSLSWWLDEGSTITGVDTAIIGGGAGGKNNCGYIHNVDVASGSGGDCKGVIDGDGNCDGVFQNITGLAVCTDGTDDVAPSPPVVAKDLPNCDFDNELDDTGITCPTYSLAEVTAAWEAHELDPDNVPAPDFKVDDQKPVVVCNFEKDKEDWGVTDGSDVCCQCGVGVDNPNDPDEKQKACVVTEDETVDNACTTEMTVDPTQSVVFTLFRSDGDPCTWLKSSRGWVQWCW